MSARRVVAYLFCPADRSALWPKALRSGAPGVVFDLEDAVAPADKAAAREDLLAWLADLPADGGPVVALRMNSVQEPAGLDDLYALAHAGPLPALRTLVLPKAESAAEVRLVARHARRHLGTRQVLPLIETALGLKEAANIASADPAVCALGFGGADFAQDMGAEFAWEPLLQARSQLVFAASAARLPVLDVPFLALDDPTGLRDECRRVRALGFAGKFAIHPAQVPIVLESFAPGPAQLAQARAIVQAFETAQGGVCVVNGRMVDVPVYQQACEVLRLAQQKPMLE